MFYYRLILCSLLLLSGCSSDSQSKSVIIKNGTSIENRIKIYKDLVKDLCKSDEKVNRHFLQQTWYHSKEFKFFLTYLTQIALRNMKTINLFQCLKSRESIVLMAITSTHSTISKTLCLEM